MVTPTWEVRPAAGRRLVHVTATAHGDGVAELVAGLVRAQAASGLAAGWAVLGGDPEFHSFTKYLHHLLHGRADARTSERLGSSMPHYHSLLTPQADWLTEQLAPGDVVVLHDPAALGMASQLSMAGFKVVWHCHVGTTEEEASGPAAVWHTFGAELSSVDALLTALPEFAPQSVRPARRHVVTPAVDKESPKNRVLAKAEITALLTDLGLLEGHTGAPLGGWVEQDAPLPEDAPVVAQVSRWDPLKDMPGALRVVTELPPDAHLVLAGPDPDQTPADPDAARVLHEVRGMLAELPAADRARVHLVLTSPRDAERTALVVNALQRRADVVLQKSLAEGFGLSVTEAMVKGRAVVAGDVGGLRQQVSPGHSGLLANPRDLDAVVAAVRTLLDDPLLRRRLGKSAAESAGRRYPMRRLVRDYGLFAAHAPLETAREVA